MNRVARFSRTPLTLASLLMVMPAAAFRAPKMAFAAAPLHLQATTPITRPRQLRTPGVCRLFASSSLELAKTQIEGNKVMIFSKSFCPFCVKAKKTLDNLGVKYEVMELDKRDDGADIQDAMVEITGGRSVPRVFIGGEFVGGGDDVAAKAMSGELQTLLKGVGALA
eukprot:CAMPEP_0177727042 /NCGR_PEP_ID=MMETSP0484_2-20121128/20104_1 /TAXON_ID=354590 /ORGANISM="Rhodomonas lens, Strain RHODO" /LENGTH=166 /DNA_ID=CAMNT_0019239657 /DNA_START=29 /DNA_END=529 /DNA_ORIENTATION=-